MVCVGGNRAPGSFMSQYPKMEYDITIAVKTVKLSLFFVAMIAFNNLCLQYVEVAFYTVARSLTIVFNVALSFVVLGERTSLMTMGTLLIVIAGFYVSAAVSVRAGSSLRVTRSHRGVVGFAGRAGGRGERLGYWHSFWHSVKPLRVPKRDLHKVDPRRCQRYVRVGCCGVGLRRRCQRDRCTVRAADDKTRLMGYNNINAVILFMPFIYIFEYDLLMSNLDVLLTPQYWGMMVIGGFCGFAIGTVTMMQIQVRRRSEWLQRVCRSSAWRWWWWVQVTSPLTHNISGTAKAATQTAIAMVFGSNPVTVKSIIGNALVLGGSSLYTYVRHNEMKK